MGKDGAAVAPTAAGGEEWLPKVRKALERALTGDGGAKGGAAHRRRGDGDAGGGGVGVHDCPVGEGGKACSGRGVCHSDLGRCQCPLAWRGAACERLVPQLCNFADGEATVSRCAGTCDMETNKCRCGARARHPDRPMHRCYYDGIDEEMPWKAIQWDNWNNAAVWHFWHNTSGIPHGENLAGYRIKMREDALKGNTWCDADPPLSNRWDLEGEAGPEPKVWRCKLDPGLKAPAFKSSS